MTDLLALSLVDLCQELSSRRVSPVELMRATLDRYELLNPTLNAICSRVPDDVLLEQARAAEARIMRGEGRPLEGIPLGVKDTEDTTGLPTTWGSPIFVDHVANHDSTQVARFKAAGAIVAGKTNVPEFASSAHTKNRVYGVTRNPWNLHMSPGGSSGGSAAALAAHMLPLVTAADGGGSVRIPACLIGAFGMKPSYGRIPNGPRKRWHWIALEHYGPITKTVADAALFLDCAVGASPYDDGSLPHPGYRYSDKLSDKLPRLKIALSPNLGDATVHSEVSSAFADAVKVFTQLGHDVVELNAPKPPDCAFMWAGLQALDLYGHIAEFLPEREGDVGRALMASVRGIASATAADMEPLMRLRSELLAWSAHVFEEVDLLLTPTLPYDGHAAAGGYPTEIEGKPAHPLGPAIFTALWNFTHQPAATVRMGLSSRGLPLGLQIIGRQHRDDVVLLAARQFERERPWHPQWPDAQSLAT